MIGAVMKKRFIWSVCFLICLNSAALFAADSVTSTNAVGTNSVPLEALVTEILNRNPELRFYTAAIDAAKGERVSAGAWLNPELSMQAGQKSVRSGGLSDEGAAWSVSVQQPLEWPGRISLRKAIANRQMAIAQIGYRQFKATLAGRARTLGFALFAAEQKAAAAREVAGRFHELREVLVQRDPAGLTPALELRIIESSEITLQKEASDAALEAQAALLELNQLRGAPWTSIVHVSSGDLVFPKAPDAEMLIETARTNNFEIQMRKAELEQQGFKVSLARKERFPTVTVGPYFSRERAGDPESIVGIGVSIPVPLWNRNKGNIETAKAREEQAQVSMFVTQRDVERRVSEQLLRYQTKLGEMSNWRPDSAEQFREAASLADRHYRLGAVPITTYVELQKQYLEAVESLLLTKKEALEAGEQLRALTGVELNSEHPQTETTR
jgi:cobalt-zinc-cadmium efflux system outer membrane protein